MRYRLLLIACIAAFTGVKAEDKSPAAIAHQHGSQNPAEWVDQTIGTGGHGHVFLGANVPFGMVQVGPTQVTKGWDWCSGYHTSDSTLIGFGHMHLSGTGIGELGDVALLPYIAHSCNHGNKTCKNAARKLEKSQHPAFMHQNERMEPGYYSVYLHEQGINVELTATQHCGMHRYTFPANVEKQSVMLNLNQGIGWDKMSECGMRQENATTITGYRYSTGWAKNQRIYFVAEFSKPITIMSLVDSLAQIDVPNDGQPLLVKVGLSAVSEDNAKMNLKAEIPAWDFMGVLADARQQWQDELSKIQINTRDAKARRIFYTALYHTMIAPSVFSDVNGDYRGADDKVHHSDDKTYTTFSLWDTYRAAHPLMTLIHPERQHDIAQTLVNIYHEQGKLPIWHLMANETDCMVGNPGSIVLADLVMKGYYKDTRLALEAMRKSDLAQDRGLPLRNQYGYIPCDLDTTYETVAKDMEYSIADGAALLVAERFGTKDDVKFFKDRSEGYRRHFNEKTGFMRGVNSKGDFREPFNPFHSVHMHDDYTEGNAWQYTWLVPHDVHGLVDLFGGEKRFTEKFDSLFIAEGDMGAEASGDITGLIGQYAHGNEPSHHVIYMYNYIGQPWKAAPLLRKVFSEMYHDGKDGLCGNEDVGQMSAWYILSAIGLYQVEPASGRYIIGSPLFDKATINVGNGKTFTLKTVNNSKENIYVQSATLNGKRYTRSYIDFKDIRNGGTLELTMGPKPSDFGTKKKDRP